MPSTRWRPPSNFFGVESINIPAPSDLASSDEVDMSSLIPIASAKKAALKDVKYWGGAPQPWRNGTDDSAVIDPSIIAEEEMRKAEAEAEDKDRAPSTNAHADLLHGFGIRADFLLFLTWRLDLWEWKTWEVVQFLVKPATETQNRCRFADVDCVRPFTGPATVFASHCWGGRWGDLVVAICGGAEKKRVVWGHLRS